MSRSTLLKLLVGLVAIAVVAVLFMRTVRDTRSAPYTLDGRLLRDWRLALAQPAGTAGALLVLRPPPEIVSSVFRQLFSRAMESLSTPTDPVMPLVLRREYEMALAGRVTPEGLMAAARESGLDSPTLDPRCLAYRRHSEPRATRQLYYLLFESREFASFRQRLAAVSGAGDGFDPEGLSPIVIVAASDGGFDRWLPVRSEPDTECVAPIDTGN